MFRYREDIVPVAIFLSFFAADLAVFFLIENRWLVVGWMLLGILPKAFISSWNHHHQHLPTFRGEFLNRCLDFVYGFLTGVTSHAWVLHHVLGHHLHYLDQEADESRWKDAEGKQMGVLRYSLVTALTAYPRCFPVARAFPKQGKVFFRMLALTLVVLAFLVWWNWFNALCIFILPMWISLYNTAWHTYYHHSGLDTDDEFQASYNILCRWYNICTGNLGYHTAHHVKMGIHWSRLPEFHDSIKDKIPTTLYRYPPPPFKWFIDRRIPPHEIGAL
ncbi:MAG: fatty acid desaturase [Bdellovibrionales bacterium]|nr:fatty acid desaturase [Bdellovibrionales bacterium]